MATSKLFLTQHLFARINPMWPSAFFIMRHAIIQISKYTTKVPRNNNLIITPTYHHLISVLRSLWHISYDEIRQHILRPQSLYNIFYEYNSSQHHYNPFILKPLFYGISIFIKLTKTNFAWKSLEPQHCKADGIEGNVVYKDKKNNNKLSSAEQQVQSVREINVCQWQLVQTDTPMKRQSDVKMPEQSLSLSGKKYRWSACIQREVVYLSCNQEIGLEQPY